MSATSGADASPVRVYLVDDHPIVRAGVRAQLDEPGLDVVGEAGSVGAALEGIEEQRPDVAIVDVRLPGGSGIDLIRELKARGVPTAFLVVTGFRDEEALIAAMLAGAAGFLVKDSPREVVVEAVREVAAGASLIGPKTLEAIRKEEPAPSGETPAALRDLSDRELEILRMVAEGMPNKEIAANLFLAEKTVRNYVSSLLSKLGLKNRTQAAAFMTGLESRQRRP